MTGITVTRRDGRLIAVKRATAEGRARRHQEAQLLARLDHPGVVQFVGLVDGETTELHMAYVGTDSWQRHPPTTETRIIEGLAAVSSTVADLHDRGTSHRSLSPEHVLVTADHRPVLCGLADAGGADSADCAVDLAGLADLMSYLARGAPPELQKQLGVLATRATSGDLTARALSDELGKIRSQDNFRDRRFSPPSPRTMVAGSVALIVALLAGWWAISSGPDAAANAPTVIPAPTKSTPTLAPDTVADATSAPPPTTLAPEAEATSAPPPTTTAPSASATQERSPLVLVHDGRRFGLGHEGDITVLGDWNCDGTATPALLQPSDDLVAIFAVWPEPGAALEASATTVVADATDLRLVELDGCDQLRIVHPTGSSLFTPEFS